jgi:hypothetical protein
MCVVMVGGGGMYALPMADLATRVPPTMVAAGGGLCAAAQSIAHIVANPLIGASVDRTGSYAIAALALSLWVVPGTLGWLLFRPPPVYRESETS